MLLWFFDGETRTFPTGGSSGCVICALLLYVEASRTRTYIVSYRACLVRHLAGFANFIVTHDTDTS